MQLLALGIWTLQLAPVETFAVIVIFSEPGVTLSVPYAVLLRDSSGEISYDSLTAKEGNTDENDVSLSLFLAYAFESRFGLCSIYFEHVRQSTGQYGRLVAAG
jgi:hypothetical protein